VIKLQHNMSVDGESDKKFRRKLYAKYYSLIGNKIWWGNILQVGCVLSTRDAAQIIVIIVK